MNQQKALETLASVYDMVAADVYDMSDDPKAKYPILEAIEAKIKRLKSINVDCSLGDELSRQIAGLRKRMTKLELKEKNRG